MQVITKADQKKEIKDYQQSAFVAWQITEFLKSALSKKPKNISFDKYLKGMGLTEKKPAEKKNELDIKRKIAKAEAIKARDTATA